MRLNDEILGGLKEDILECRALRALREEYELPARAAAADEALSVCADCMHPLSFLRLG